MATSNHTQQGPDWHLLHSGICFLQVKNHNTLHVYVGNDAPDGLSAYHEVTRHFPFTSRSTDDLYIRAADPERAVGLTYTPGA